ncbi:MAG: hypothetical protein QOC65_1544 [Sphingomonadales bacterium]|nr:hypothetical protein [Sphingomonadales bacterium]
MAQPLLHHRQHLLVAPAFGVEDPARRQAGLREAGGEQVAAGQRPEHNPLPARPARGDRCGEQSRGRVVAEARRGAGNLVQGIDGEAAAGETAVDRLEPEGQAYTRAAAPALGERRDLGAKRGDSGFDGHVATRTHMFVICSDCIQRESSGTQLAMLRRVQLLSWPMRRIVPNPNLLLPTTAALLAGGALLYDRPPPASPPARVSFAAQMRSAAAVDHYLPAHCGPTTELREPSFVIAACTEAIGEREAGLPRAHAGDSYWDALPNVYRANAYFSSGDWTRAIADYSAAIGIDPTGWSNYLGRGKAYSRMRDYAHALPDLDRSISLFPSNADSYLERGFARHRNNDPKGALTDFTSAIRHASLFDYAYAMRGTAHAIARHPARARADARRSLALARHKPAIRAAYCWTAARARPQRQGQHCASHSRHIADRDPLGSLFASYAAEQR